jgi:hypothetical protein
VPTKLCLKPDSAFLHNNANISIQEIQVHCTIHAFAEDELQAEIKKFSTSSLLNSYGYMGTVSRRNMCMLRTKLLWEN